MTAGPASGPVVVVEGLFYYNSKGHENSYHTSLREKISGKSGLGSRVFSVIKVKYIL